MKRIVFILFFYILTLFIAFGQEMPAFVKERLDSVKIKARIALEEVRIYENGYREMKGKLPEANLLSSEFSDKEIEVINGIGLKLQIGMVFDNEMRDRLVQLLRNEYRKEELDTLVNIQINNNISLFENDAMKICKFDTMQIFKTTLDSFYIDLNNKNQVQFSINMYKYDVFKLLHLDTTTIFKQVFNKIVTIEEERERENWLTNVNYNYTSFAILCGYINDERFIKPLVEALSKSSKSDNFQQEKVLEALARMRVEPYYSDYIKKRTLSEEQIMDEKNWLDFDIDDFVYVLGTQEAFLELSKYLLSNKPYQMEIIDYADHSETHYNPISLGAFYLIRDNIENKDIQAIIGPNREDVEILLKPLYDWMQKNYGNYKIRRIW